jgi:hypothetical protein
MRKMRNSNIQKDCTLSTSLGGYVADSESGDAGLGLHRFRVIGWSATWSASHDRATAGRPRTNTWLSSGVLAEKWVYSKSRDRRVQQKARKRSAA